MSNDNIDYSLLEQLKTQRKLSEIEQPLRELIGSEHLYSFLRLVEILRCISDRITIGISPEEVSFTATHLNSVDDLGTVLKETTTEITSSFDFCEDTDNSTDYKQMFNEGVNDAFDAIKTLVFTKPVKGDEDE